MGVLSKEAILKRIENVPKPLIVGFLSKSLQGASYDLHLGDEYLKGGSLYKLDSSTSQYLEIPAHDVVVVATSEKVNIPTDLVGHFGLRLGLVMKGLVLNNEPQIDPGYSGRLFCLLYNLTDKSIILTDNQSFATIEFETVEGTCNEYKGPYRKADHISDAVREILPRSGLKELSDDFKKMESRLTRKVDHFYTLFFTVITIILAVLGFLVTRILIGP